MGEGTAAALLPSYGTGQRSRRTSAMLPARLPQPTNPSPQPRRSCHWCQPVLFQGRAQSALLPLLWRLGMLPGRFPALPDSLLCSVPAQLEGVAPPPEPPRVSSWSSLRLARKVSSGAILYVRCRFHLQRLLQQATEPEGQARVISKSRSRSKRIFPVPFLSLRL
jgi:hypothetical protein